MDFCVEAGIPHSEFLSWSSDDQSKAIAYILYKRSLCQKCGTNPQDWLDEEGKPLEPPPYTVVTVKCHGCATLEEANAEIPKESKGTITAHLGRASRTTRRTAKEWQMKKSP